jgi:exonuclease VII small subunit
MTKNDPMIQDKIAELDELLAWFNSDEFVLEQAGDKLKAAKKLADDIETGLNSLENEIEVIKKSFASDAEK